MKGIRKGVLIFIVLLQHAVFAQDCDIIILQDGSEFEAKVLEISADNISYKKCDFPDGPKYVVVRSNVFLIKYKDGSKELMSDNKAVMVDTKAPKEVTILTKKKIDPNVTVYESIDEIPIDGKCLTVNFKRSAINIEIIKIKGSSIIFYHCEAKGMEKKYIMKSGIISIDNENGNVIYSKNYQ